MNQNIANKDHRTYMEGGLLNDLRILLNSPQQEEGIENKRVDSQSHIENNSFESLKLDHSLFQNPNHNMFNLRPMNYFIPKIYRKKV